MSRLLATILGRGLLAIAAIALPRAGQAWVPDTSLADASATFWGESISGPIAYLVVSDARDVNGDGYGDFLVGSPQMDSNGEDAGKAYLILGKPTGWLQDSLLLDVDASFVGEFEDDRAGFAFPGGGDLDGDGLDDVVLSAIYADHHHLRKIMDGITV